MESSGNLFRGKTFCAPNKCRLVRKTLELGRTLRPFKQNDFDETLLQVVLS